MIQILNAKNVKKIFFCIKIDVIDKKLKIVKVILNLSSVLNVKMVINLKQKIKKKFVEELKS